MRISSGWRCRCCLHRLATEKLVGLGHEQGTSKNKQHLTKTFSTLQIPPSVTPKLTRNCACLGLQNYSTTLGWQLKNTLTDTEIETFFNVCVLATISDTSYGHSCALRGVRGTFTGSSTHEVTCTQTHAHEHTYAPFGGDNNPLSTQGKKIYLYHCNGTFSVKCHFSNVHRQLTGTGFFAVAPGLASMVGCVVLCHLHLSGMQQ